MKYTVGSEQFKTKDAITARVRGIFASYQHGESLSGNDLLFALDLFTWHKNYENKRGEGIASVEIRNFKFRGKTYKQFYIIREDGSETDISYRKCLKYPSQLQIVYNALRTVIAPQIDKFKLSIFAGNNFPVCPFTNETLRWTMSHVDHVPPLTFEKLAKDWLHSEGLSAEDIEVTGVMEDMAIIKDVADPDLRQRWFDYHQQNADLRIVSKLANLSHVKQGAKS